MISNREIEPPKVFYLRLRLDHVAPGSRAMDGRYLIETLLCP